MFVIKMNVRNQRLSRYTSGIVAENSYGYLKFEFNFKTDDWSEVTSKMAVFSYRGRNSSPIQLDENNQCYVPAEVIKTPYFGVSVYGGGITTNIVKIPVVESDDFSDNNNTSGVVFVPYISDEKILSWTNNGGLENPAPVDLNPFDEWTEDGDVTSEYEWEEE